MMTPFKPIPPGDSPPPWRKRLLWFVGIYAMSLTAAAVTVYLLRATLL